MKRDQKKEIRKMGYKELRERLIQLNTERLKLETDMMVKNGTSTSQRNYPWEPHVGNYGNLKRIKKTIAFVKSVLMERGDGV